MATLTRIGKHNVLVMRLARLLETRHILRRAKMARADLKAGKTINLHDLQG